MEFDPEQIRPENRREVDPPVEVELATWPAGGTVDWCVKERLELTAGCGAKTAVNGGSRPLIFDRRRATSVGLPNPEGEMWDCVNDFPCHRAVSLLVLASPTCDGKGPRGVGRS